MSAKWQSQDCAELVEVQRKLPNERNAPNVQQSLDSYCAFLSVCWCVAIAAPAPGKRNRALQRQASDPQNVPKSSFLIQSVKDTYFTLVRPAPSTHSRIKLPELKRGRQRGRHRQERQLIDYRVFLTFAPLPATTLLTARHCESMAQGETAQRWTSSIRVRAFYLRAKATRGCDNTSTGNAARIQEQMPRVAGLLREQGIPTGPATQVDSQQAAMDDAMQGYVLKERARSLNAPYERLSCDAATDLVVAMACCTVLAVRH
ncbi:hypothetical protein GQ600_24451 [Phytophthora cactorum]|nr:hypothetical protein GQ600_24451 [Phytophthora cactorum]